MQMPSPTLRTVIVSQTMDRCADRPPRFLILGEDCNFLGKKTEPEPDNRASKASLRGINGGMKELQPCNREHCTHAEISEEALAKMHKVSAASGRFFQGCVSHCKAFGQSPASKNYTAKDGESQVNEILP